MFLDGDALLGLYSGSEGHVVGFRAPAWEIRRPDQPATPAPEDCVSLGAMLPDDECMPVLTPAEHPHGNATEEFMWVLRTVGQAFRSRKRLWPLPVETPPRRPNEDAASSGALLPHWPTHLATHRSPRSGVGPRPLEGHRHPTMG